MFSQILAAALSGLHLERDIIIDGIAKMHPQYGGRRSLYTWWKRVDPECARNAFIDTRPPFGRQQLRAAARALAKRESRKRRAAQRELSLADLRESTRAVASAPANLPELREAA